ncbi:MAG TPA: endonuclease/exonuclease/phosphatase family protein [Burkholderiaceae bacterium]|jgi:endonuclease/exonuclease/phosphatase family metal-dependent hydrolase
MPHITDTKKVSKDIAAGLLVLKERIAAARIPSSKLDESFNLATWNIREFGKKARSEAAIHYIAEVMSQFDLISVVELRDDLRDLRRVLDVLGPYWRAVYSDAVLDAGGNRERVAFVYDKRQIAFNGMASTAQATRTKQGTEWVPDFNWWRPPYEASFKSGAFDFVLVCTHVRWGDSEGGRVPELKALADWAAEKLALFKKDKRSFDDQDMFVMGDFNIPSTKSALYAAITSTGLQMPAGLAAPDLGSNLQKNKRYDQILQWPNYPENFSNLGGVLDFYCGNSKALFPDLTLDAFTFQMSDHLPLWIQVNTNVEAKRLDQIIQS